MKLVVILFSFVFLQEQIPFKQKEEFDIKLNFEFKQRILETSKVSFEPTNRSGRTHTGPLPYLTIKVTVLKIGEGETKVRIVDNFSNNFLTRKLEKSNAFNLDVGFTDDIKDRISAHEYTAYFLTADKAVSSRILISFDEDGTYYVNGEKRGRI